MSVVCTVAEVVEHSFEVDVSASRTKERLTPRQQKSVSFEMESTTSPQKQNLRSKRVAGHKVENDVALFVCRKTGKAKRVRLALLSNDEVEDHSYSASTGY